MRHPILAAWVVAGTAAGCASIGVVDPPGQGQAEGSTNPFKGVNFFLNPEYTASVEATAQQHPDEADRIRKAAQYPTGVWLSDIKAVENLPGWLDQAKQQQDASGVPTMTLIVVYDLPERDCSAESSAGELRADENGEPATAPSSSIRSRHSSRRTRISPSPSCSSPTRSATWRPT